MTIWTTLHLLAQTASAAAPPVPAVPAPSPVPGAPSWVSLDTLFWLTIFVIFFVALFSALLRRMAKDKTLKLFHEYHVAFFSEKRTSLWGDCLVSSQGIELLFDTAFITRRKLVKSSALVYEDEFTPMIALTRSIHGLNDEELHDRAQQIHQTFKPGTRRRMHRWFRNLLNTMRDAITKAMTVAIGRLSATSGSLAGVAMSTQANDISALTGSVVSFAANAYEPLLERYIGQSVVVEITLPLPPQPPPIVGMPIPPLPPAETAEFPGYLVDYSQKFLAVFNVEHTPIETLEITLEPGKPSIPEMPELKVSTTAQDTIVKCEGKDAWVLRRIATKETSWDLGIALIPGTGVILPPLIDLARLTVERTRQIDLMVPRTRARIRYGSMPVRPANRSRENWIGLAPVQEGREFLTALRGRVQTIGEQLRNGLTRPIGERKPSDDIDRNEPKS